MAVDRKQDIIEAATKSFSLFGYKATTMDQVAKLANVGKGTIYTFFKNKEELFDEIIQTLIAEMREAAEKAIDPSLTFHENVHRALFEILQFRRRHQLTIKLFQEGKEMGTPAVLDVMAMMEEAVLSFIKEKVLLAVQAGKIKPCNPEVTAFVMFKLYISLIFDWEQRGAPLSEEEISRLFELYLFEGLST
ncbi:TetR/AcrR family transcriptional regulator [Bacillus badius]|uniref:Transcriptional regulator, TetR family n=1 Tax=Bacillus badius TaxID=1455 RepID=A0ABR5AS84_BACBA|nr:TetR/AcrR family transcriptional regulator [Bacillus badius]KIL73060.1 Transcriptional regulator, TetR family [Bacillus badius]KIL77605.1 Transcriptional regulator, TetR family [Bacillus badius]KZO01187.1 TetR family transcriptional regulator [Bacillus badius]KZR59060.1 TetR family transcriptional regulator [Bacillus badius]MED0667870.1 TetR/AcrR family transcriptional regulator [Bacillus badius]